MGRITTPSPAAPPASASAPAEALNHFSHPHHLHSTSSPLSNQLCAACSLPTTAKMYSCIPCNFSLHQSCATLPRHITHPSHGGCTLALLTSPSYDTAAFCCNACRVPGYAWNYHCSRCEYDLHVTCACKPTTVRHPSHACELHLSFKNPYPNAIGFTCNICRQIETRQWQYHCHSCSFDAHLDCIAATAPGQTPHQVVHQPQHLPPAPVSHCLVNSVRGYNNPAPPALARPTMISNFARAALQGLVGGVFQAVGQTAVLDVVAGEDT